MGQTQRLVCRLPVKTIANRRARRLEPTVPPTHTEFTDEELEIFKGMERRGASGPSLPTLK
jgi:hypothetical protein